MAKVIMAEEPRVIDTSKVGQDERNLLAALHGTGALGKKLKSELKDAKKAAFKIEVHFGKNRTMNLHKPNTGAVTIWESGRRLHGGGDEKMYWCGWSRDWKYSEQDSICGLPIKTEFFAVNHVVCPHCQRECFLDHIVKARHIEVAKEDGKDWEGIERIPTVVGERFFNATPKNLAAVLAKYWHELEGNADIYMKYHPSDIRCRDVEEIRKPGIYEKAREKRKDGLLIYPLSRISKDIAAGASVERRFLAMIQA